MEDGSIGLIDFGQVKQISGRERLTLAEVMVALAERESDDNPDDLATISRLALELGVKLRPGSPKEGPAATAMWLFDGKTEKLPGGFDTGELSPNSPVTVLQSFPQDLVLVGRSTVLIKVRVRVRVRARVTLTLTLILTLTLTLTLILTSASDHETLTRAAMPLMSTVERPTRTRS